MNELTVVLRQRQSRPAGMKAPGTQSAADGDGNDISVLLASEITADVDAAGLEKLEKLLAKYKEILKLL